ncbi:MAG: hypothetical protein DRI61_06610 [Chloroflexi bacterium]|nr:MAG: hypothetical protein DRI61_06610 [Chloroflexota bacterium]
MKKEPIGHATFGPSSASRWMACPGSIYLSSQVPKPKSSPHAAQGTKEHDAAEVILNDWLNGTGDILSAFNNNRTLFDENAEAEDAVATYVMFIARLLLKQQVSWVGIEEKFMIDESIDLWGTGDFSFTYDLKRGKRGVVVDYKGGRGVTVAAEGNPQLQLYAIGLNESQGPLRRVDVHICQPRSEDGEVIKSVSYSALQLKQLKEHFLAAAATCIRQQRGEEPEYTAGDHCRWCPALAVCRAYARSQKDDAEVDFEKLPILKPKEELPIDILTDEQIMRIVLARPNIESYLKRVEEYALQRFQEHAPVPGLKAVHGRSVRAWDGDMALVAAALEARGVDDPYNKRLKGLGEIEKEIGKGKIDDLVRKTKPSLKIVKGYDKRGAVDYGGGAKEDFEVV